MQGHPSPHHQEVYRTQFVIRCATLLFAGRDRLRSTSLATLHEQDITGLLVDAMQAILEADNAETWMWNFAVNDDPPQSTKGRLGKKRPRIDILMVESGRPGTRPRFLIEAKRLHGSDSVSQYFGPSGLGMFLTGDYAPGQSCAGMLGYIQTQDIDHWRTAVESRSQLTPADPVPDRHTRTSSHPRNGLSTILIYHFFLDCR